MPTTCHIKRNADNTANYARTHTHTHTHTHRQKKTPARRHQRLTTFFAKRYWCMMPLMASIQASRLRSEEQKKYTVVPSETTWKNPPNCSPPKLLKMNCVRAWTALATKHRFFLNKSGLPGAICDTSFKTCTDSMGTKWPAGSLVSLESLSCD